MENHLLKFITCGSVDDGKSTLIGHMLYDAKLLFADQKKALELDSRLGSREGKVDYSLLLDGLVAEREQGITIDVAYRYFSTENRSFIVADTPGHEEYTRNMAVGASFASLAVILVDASHGVVIQTKRHARICALMGIRHFVFAVNKMDLVEYNPRKLAKIEKDIHALMTEFPYRSLQIIPVSATEGDNIIQMSERMPWYQGKPLLAYLETVEVGEEQASGAFVMPVQRVCRPDPSFRGFQGEISQGTIACGDEVTVLPSGETANVTKILRGDQKASRAGSGEAVTLRLNREIDVSRGCVLTRDKTLLTGTMFGANLLWMDDNYLVAGRNFFLKLGTQMVPATVLNIRYKIDINTGTEVYADHVYKNEIAYCEISTGSEIVFQEFGKNKDLGSLILIDRVSDMTSACGTIERNIPRGKSLVWHNMDVTRQLRERQMGQKALTVWMTGLSGAGKSTLANEVEKRLFSAGHYTMLLDGDNIRMGLNRNLGFEENDRIENIRRIAEVAKLMNDAGLIVLTSFISPFRQDRRNAREIIGEGFIEVYVKASLEACEKRDVKHLYRDARAGKILNFTGISSPYESPEHPEIIVDTERQPIEECVGRIVGYLEQRMHADP